MSQSTYVPSEDDLERQWVIFDADGVPLGRLATRVARVLRGKHKPTFTPHLDCGDGAIVVNARDLVVTGKKDVQEFIPRHSGYPGGLKKDYYGELLEKNPEKIVRAAVKGMIPKNRLGRKMLKHLRIYADSEHEQQAQQPVRYDWENDRVPRGS